MKNITIAINATLSLLVLLSTMPAVQAQAQQNSGPTYVSQLPEMDLPDGTVEAGAPFHQIGTSELQQKVLMKINAALIDGSLSAAEAADWKAKLNKVNQQESWYKSVSRSIPASLIAANSLILNDMTAKLAPKAKISSAAPNALHSDIHDSIGDALAHNRISSSEAEKYYMRLAQSESNLEGVERSSGLVGQKSKVNKDLAEIKSELAR